MRSLNDIKSWFKTGKFPTESQFSQTWESFWHKAEKISMNAVENLEQILSLKADRDLVDRQVQNLRDTKENVGVANELVTAHNAAQDAHQELFDLKANDADVYHRNELDARFNSHETDTELHWMEGEREARTAEVDAKLALKVDKVEGKQLSTNDYTTGEKEKLARATDLAKNLALGYSDQAADREVYLKWTRQDLDTKTTELKSEALPVVTATHNGVVTPVEKEILDGLSVSGVHVGAWGTPSPTWKIGGTTGVMLKKSGEVLEVRNSSDAAYADFTVNNITIKGNVVQEGDSFISNAETVETADNLILLNKGEAGAGVTKGNAGLEIDRGSEPNYQILFDESDDRFKAGKAGDLHTVALRDDDAAFADQHLVKWDATTKTFKDGGTIPVLSGGSAAESGKYIAGVSVSGHTLSVTKSSLPTSLPASDVPAWAKAASKPAYTWTEIGSKPVFATVATSGSYNDLSNKPSIPSLSGYATQTWVQSQGYLTAHQSLAGYMPKSGGQFTGAVTSTSSISANGGFYDTSDERVKTNVCGIHLQPEPIVLHEFDRTDIAKHGYGVIAQEVERLYPDTVYTDEEGFKRVNSTEILYIKCAELEARLKRLEEKYAELSHLSGPENLWEE